MTYSIDMRRKVLKVRQEEGLSMAKVAKRFGVSLVSVMRWSKTLESITKRNKPATKIDMEALKLDVEAHPDAYLKERAQRLQVSHNCVWHAPKRLNVTYKKNPKSPQGGPRKTLCFLRRDKES